MLDFSRAPSALANAQHAPQAPADPVGLGAGAQSVPSRRQVSNSASGTTSAAFDITPRPGSTVLVKRYNARFTEYLTRSRNTLERLTALETEVVPGLPRLMRAGLSGGQLTTLLEGLEGEPLDQVIASHRGGLDPQVATEVIGHLADALAGMHGLGLLHLDVRPAVIVMEQNSGQASFIDLGHAVPLGERQKTLGAIPGVGIEGVPYSSGELMAGAQPDASDDVYSLGCVAYEILTGRHPFERRGASDALALGLQPAPIPQLDPARSAILRQALLLRREDRRLTMAEFAAAFAGTPQRVTAKWAPRKVGKTTWIAAGATAAVAVIAGVLLLKPAFLFGGSGPSVTANAAVTPKPNVQPREPSVDPRVVPAPVAPASPTVSPRVTVPDAVSSTNGSPSGTPEVRSASPAPAPVPPASVAAAPARLEPPAAVTEQPRTAPVPIPVQPQALKPPPAIVLAPKPAPQAPAIGPLPNVVRDEPAGAVDIAAANRATQQLGPGFIPGIGEPPAPGSVVQRVPPQAIERPAPPVQAQGSAAAAARVSCPTCSCSNLREKRFLSGQSLSWEEASYFLHVCGGG